MGRTIAKYQGRTRAEWLSDMRRRGKEDNAKIDLEMKSKMEAIQNRRKESAKRNKQIIQDLKDVIFCKQKEFERYTESGDAFNASLIAEDLKILKKDLWFKKKTLETQ